MIRLITIPIMHCVIEAKNVDPFHWKFTQMFTFINPSRLFHKKHYCARENLKNNLD
jgi:hypothetical protein